MEMKRLEIFCRVVELKSFTRAAEASLLTQPTVSENIRLLEEAVDERLLDRLGREVLPTPAGDILYRYARGILQLRDEARQALAEYRGRLCGELLIGASTIPGTYLLPALLAAFRASHPQVHPILKISGSGQVIASLLEGELSIGLVGAEVSDGRLESRRLPGDELLLVVPPGHPWWAREEVAASELADQPFILRERGSGTRQVMAAALRGQGLELDGLDVRAEMGSSEAVRQAVRAGLGIAILSSLAVAEDIARGVLQSLPIAGIRMQRPFFLVHRRGRQLSPLATAFCDHLIAGD
jgi:DNA-binding transcriptional LysR family regulator